MSKAIKDGKIKMSELAKASGVRYSTIKYYSEIGLLPYSQQGRGLVRRFDGAQSLRRLQEIRALKNKRQTIQGIRQHFKK